MKHQVIVWTNDGTRASISTDRGYEHAKLLARAARTPMNRTVKIVAEHAGTTDQWVRAVLGARPARWKREKKKGVRV